MALLIISLSAFLAAVLTFFSGFGLGTLLMPVVAIFLPVPIAIALTALVHCLNNIFKLFILRKNVHWGVTFKFGVPAIITAIFGAWLLTTISAIPPVLSYSFFHVVATVAWVKIVTGVLLIIFASLEWKTMGKSAFFSAKWLPVGGLLSGFFGGLSGQQGAFRTPFLLHAGLTKEQFVSTNASIAVLVDLARLIVYISLLQQFLQQQADLLLLSSAIIAAFLGSILGFMGLKKITLTAIQRVIAVLLYLLGILLIIGII